MEVGKVIPLQFVDKAERNGYYKITAISADMNDYQGEVMTTNWKFDLDRLGSDTEVDIQSRLTGTVRLNNFSLTGEKWHAPSIGHYSYTTGSTSPSTMTRTGEDGAIIVYRSVPSSVSPKWGCPVENYLSGRVRVFDTLRVSTTNELEGVDREMGTLTWNMKNGLVNLTPGSSAGVFNNASYSASAYHTKNWTVEVGGVAPTWDAATMIRNDAEQCIIRLVASRTTAGRVSLDLVLRRGSRFVEGYLQSNSSATLSVYPTTAESNLSDFSSAGYVTRSTADADGNRFVTGSAKTFTMHANGGVTKTSTTSLDFFIGSTGATGASGVGQSGDAATDLRNQYIGAMAESTYAVRR